MQQQPTHFDNNDEAHWIELAKSVNDPETASRIVTFLDGYPELRKRHAGLYLVACEVIQRKRMNDLAIELRNRTLQRSRKTFGKVCHLAYRIGRLFVRASIQLSSYLLSNQEPGRKSRYHTVIYPAAKPVQSAAKWKFCDCCRSPIGIRQGRCDECGHVVNQMPAFAAQA